MLALTDGWLAPSTTNYLSRGEKNTRHRKCDSEEHNQWQEEVIEVSYTPSKEVSKLLKTITFMSSLYPLHRKEEMHKENKFSRLNFTTIYDDGSSITAASTYRSSYSVV